MNAFNTLDDAIIKFIDDRPGVHPIHSSTLLSIAGKALESKGCDPSRPSNGDATWRLIDRRLQALRKAGRIKYARHVGLKPRWEVVTPANR